MKLIIDIPDETKNNIGFYGLFLNPRDKENLVNAIKNGKPLENELQKIRQEITDLKKDFDKYDDWRKKDGLFYALKIIDKYIKE